MALVDGDYEVLADLGRLGDDLVLDAQLAVLVGVLCVGDDVVDLAAKGSAAGVCLDAVLRSDGDYSHLGGMAGRRNLDRFAFSHRDGVLDVGVGEHVRFVSSQS